MTRRWCLWALDSDMLRLLLPADYLVEPLASELPRRLVDREFNRLWQSETLVQLLCGRCMMCGDTMGGSDLQLHLLSFHHCQERGLMMFVPQILRLLEPPLDCENGCQVLRTCLHGCSSSFAGLSHPNFPLHQRLQFGPDGGQFHGSIIGGAPMLGTVVGQRK